MAKMTSAQAEKWLKQLNEQHSALLEIEQKSSVFTAAIQENVEDSLFVIVQCSPKETV